MTEIGDNLRALMIQARTDYRRRGKSRGLTRAELAGKTGLSEIWLRQIENGQAATAPASTLGGICHALRIDSVYLRALGYSDVAMAVDACVMLKENAIPDHLIDRPERSAEDHIRGTPGITARERKLLLEALYAIRKQPA